MNPAAPKGKELEQIGKDEVEKLNHHNSKLTLIISAVILLTTFGGGAAWCTAIQLRMENLDSRQQSLELRMTGITTTVERTDRNVGVIGRKLGILPDNLETK